MKKVSGKTHTQKQLDDWSNQNNPNNKAYKANKDNHSNQMNPIIRHISKFTILAAETKHNYGLIGLPTIPIMTIKHFKEANL